MLLTSSAFFISDMGWVLFLCFDLIVMQYVKNREISLIVNLPY